MTTNNTYTPYRAMQSKLEQLRDFRGSSATAVFTGTRYIIKSYETVILDLNTKTGELLFNNCYYSRTTSKIQNMIKVAFNLINCKERKCFLMINGSIKAHFETLKEAEA
jgi:hypothetical protein